MALAAVKFIGKMIVSYAASRAVTDMTGNATLGAVAGALTSYGMSSAMSTGAASAGSVASDSAAKSSVNASTGSQITPGVANTAPAAAQTGTDTVLASSGGSTAPAVLPADAGGASGTGGGLLSKAWDGAKSYAASDAGKEMIAKTVAQGVQGYAESEQKKRADERLTQFRSDEFQKDRDFKARHDAAMGGDPNVYRMGQSGERRVSGFLGDQHQGLLDMYRELYDKDSE